jgi:hypothetical protein
LEIQHRIYRDRQIVARQREFVEKSGEQLPIAVALLRNFESHLAALEETQATLWGNKARRGSGKTAGSPLQSSCCRPNLE